MIIKTNNRRSKTCFKLGWNLIADEESPMLECGDKCPNGCLFHLDCMGLSERPEVDWWCPSCDGHNQHCCKETKPNEEWIGCSSSTRCFRGEWFHIGCVNLSEQIRGLLATNPRNPQTNRGRVRSANVSASAPLRAISERSCSSYNS